MTIRARLLWLTLGLIVPLVLVGFFNLWRAWESSREQLNDSIEQQAELAATAFEQRIKAYQQTLITISDLAQSDPSNNVLKDYLNSIVKTRPHWLDVQIVNGNGEIILSQTVKNKNLGAVSIQTLLREVQQKKSLVIFTEQLEDKELRLLSLAFPLPENNFIVARIDGTSTSEVFKELELPEDNIIVVFDGNNRLLYRSSATPVQMSLDVSQTELLTALKNKHRTVVEVESPYDKVRRVYGLARAESANCMIAVGIPSTRLYQPAFRQFAGQSIFSLLIALMAICAAMLIARSIVKPLHSLTQVARRFGAGDLTARAPAARMAGVRELGETFNQMAAQIEIREEELRKLDRLKSEFVSSVSHELRTPLTTIKTLTRVLQKNNISEEEREEYLKTIAVECDRQIEFVQNLLDLSRIESGAFKIALAQTDVESILQAIVESLKHTTLLRDLNLSLKLENELPSIATDAGAFRRIIVSLIENAMKYTPEGGVIRVSARRDENQIRIEITDNGCGINAGDLPFVFDKFYRGRPLEVSASVGSLRGPATFVGECPPPQETSGVGLGLYLVKNLVEQLGGTIKVESPVIEFGRGSRFSIFLPL